MSSYRDILDAEIVAYKPVRYRLMKRYATNTMVIPVCLFNGPNMQLNDSTVPGTYTTIDTFELWVPDCCVGAGGTRLVVRADITVNTSGIGAVNWQIEHSGDAGSTSLTSSGGSEGPETKDLTMDFTPTGNDYETINVQVRDPGAGYIDTDFDWLLTQGGSYLAPLPR